MAKKIKIPYQMGQNIPAQPSGGFVDWRSGHTPMPKKGTKKKPKNMKINQPLKKNSRVNEAGSARMA